jgi:hypothetical protein
LDALIQLSENVPLLSSSVERYLVLSAVRVVHTLTADSPRHLSTEDESKGTAADSTRYLSTEDESKGATADSTRYVSTED